MGNSEWEKNTALTEEANKRYETTEAQIQMTKNEIAALGIDIAKQLLPILKDGLTAIKGLVDKFSQLSPETQKGIVKFGLFAAAAGPVISGVGKITSGLGGIIKIGGSVATKLGLISSSASAVGTAAGAASGAAGMGGLVAGLGSAIAAAAPFILGAAAIGVAAYGIYKVLSSDVIPEVDLFGKECSEATKEAVGAYLEMDEKVRSTLEDLYINSKVITEGIKNDIVAQTNEMANQVIARLRTKEKRKHPKFTRNVCLRKNTNRRNTGGNSGKNK